MPRFPVASGKEVVAALIRIGYAVVRVSGSHHFLKHPDRPHLCNVPVHGNKPLKRKILKSIIDLIGMTAAEFRELL